MKYWLFYSLAIPRKVSPDTFTTYPNFDYLGDIQDSLLEMEGNVYNIW